MADIFNGGTVKLFYNLDTANQNVISSGNIEIENVATFPTFSISDSANKIETYDSEYTRTVVGDKAIGDLEIVVNYRPDSETHQFLDSAYDNKTEFQLIVNYIEDQDAGKVEAVIVSGNINSRMISGDKDDVVRMTYTYSPRTIISMGTRLIPPVLRRGDYGVGSDGTPDYPQYSPQEAEGNAFVMIPAADLDNPAGTDLYGIELVSQPTGQSNTNLMLTDSGDLRIYARNNTTPWSRVYTSGESDTLYLSKANNLSDLDNVITARSNLGILSTTENDSRYMIGSRNLSELTDKAVALSNLGILSTVQNDTRYLKTASNLSDITSADDARANLNMSSFYNNALDAYVRNPANYNQFIYMNNTGRWGAYDASTQQEIALGVQQGGTGSNTPAGARVNLELNRFNQGTGETFIQSPDTMKYLTVGNDGWGYWNTQTQQFSPLGILQGGTGATTVQQAKINLQIERLQQQDNGTFLRGNGTSNVGLFVQDGTWGAMNLSSGARIALPINNGGTGALTVDGARNNLNLGAGQSVDFSGVNAHNWNDAAQYNGGILTSRLMNTSNGTRSWSRFYSEIQADGIPKTTIHSGDGANRNAYMQFTCTGLLSGIDTLSVNSKIRTPTIAVTDRMSIGTPGDAQALGARSIAIGDSDTGFAQQSDGVLDVYANAARVATYTTSGLTLNNTKMIVNQTNREENAIYSGIPRNGTSAALIAGQVDGVPNWANWRDRAAGMLVEIPGEGKCVNIWKSVQWGTQWTTSFDVFNPAGGTVEARLNVGGAFFMYTSAGVGTATSWVSTSDQRLKSNIEEITGSLDKLKKLTGYTYDKRSDLTPNEHTYTSHEAGLIAQEVQKVLPEAVTSSGDESLLAVNSYAVQALQINATKELDAKVEANEETIAVLTSKVEAQALQLEAQQQQIDELKALVQSLITK
ncbi:tail fiber domain-containing protein [Salmonella enterica]|nr:tail fiber domain-containing protein [Salmonella enterica]ELH3470127.1 tail fiber domain-containing protein [Salmonella enterica]